MKHTPVQYMLGDIYFRKIDMWFSHAFQNEIGIIVVIIQEMENLSKICDIGF